MWRRQKAANTISNAQDVVHYSSITIKSATQAKVTEASNKDRPLRSFGLIIDVGICMATKAWAITLIEPIGPNQYLTWQFRAGDQNTDVSDHQSSLSFQQNQESFRALSLSSFLSLEWISHPVVIERVSGDPKFTPQSSFMAIKATTKRKITDETQKKKKKK
ncbi:hypothetical protein BVC80_9083g137 [Macleaya cordata]|uniref:Uncharacterized protein n=1 Tax=Macleaya cordata TaxID=56857 RepID=A0A200PRK0_MACCD|nr:hypothetical protein BVC80_9083g137 [Macleaya cordata]